MVADQATRPAVVVADDAPSIRALYRRVFELAGFEVATAETGTAALRLVRQLDAAALVLDGRLADMTGEDVLDRLRDDPNTDDVSVVMVTADDAPDRQRAALNRGADDYLIKPVHPRELVRRIQDQLRARDRWLSRIDAAASRRQQLAHGLAEVDATLPLPGMVAAVIDALGTAVDVSAGAVTPVVAGALGRPVGAGDDTAIEELTQDVEPAVTAPMLDRRGNAAWAHVPLQWHDEVFAVLSVSSSASAHRLLTAVLDARSQLTMLFHPALTREIEVRRMIDAIDAMSQEQSIVPVFQPILELATGRTVGFEGLSRFPDAASPVQWFRQAGRLGVGPRLEVAALEAVIRAAAALPSSVFLAVNVSVDTLLTTDLGPLLAGSAHHLVIEITEHDLVSDYTALAEAMARLDGVGLCVDDAGSGHASLRHVFQLRPEIVKLDRDWITRLDQDPARQSLVRGLLEFAGHLGAVLLAEGIETDGERRTLIDLGVPLGQGYLLGPPSTEQAWT